MNNLTGEQLAHMEVLRSAILYVRAVSYDGSKNDSSLLVADLMDAVHNAPSFIVNMYSSTEEYVKLYYSVFDKKYPNTISLVRIFNSALEKVHNKA